MQMVFKKMIQKLTSHVSPFMVKKSFLLNRIIQLLLLLNISDYLCQARAYIFNSFQTVVQYSVLASDWLVWISDKVTTSTQSDEGMFNFKMFI